MAKLICDFLNSFNGDKGHEEEFEQFVEVTATRPVISSICINSSKKKHNDLFN
jgi:hypothetical protein